MKRNGGWGIAALLLVSSLLSTVPLVAAETDTRLVEAVRAGNRASVRTLLQQPGINVNAALGSGTTALHWAAYQDDLETAELLVRAGANVKAVNRYGVTPLSPACQNGNGAMVQLLLNAGADPNTVLPGGESVLMTAARTGKIEAMNALISRGADVNAKVAESGQTALMWAAAEGNVPAVEMLIKAGADLRAREQSGFTAFLYAVRDGQANVVRSLLKSGTDVNETVQVAARRTKRGRGGPTPSAGTSALSLAVVNGHFELATTLLEAGADPNAAGQGWAPLHSISWYRKPGQGDNDPAPQGSGSMTSLELVKKLVDHGANVNQRMTRNVNVAKTILNTNGSTPFLLAARTADAELMRYLAKLGADPLIPNEDGSTPLMVAAGLGTRYPGQDAGLEDEVVEAMQVALDLGNDINAVDRNGETAMHGAAYKNSPAAVKFLTEKGAKLDVWNKKNRLGWTPLLIASGYRFGNFKPSPETEAVIRKVMTDAGVSTDVESASNCDTNADVICEGFTGAK